MMQPDGEMVDSGRQLGPYRLRETIGRGGSAIVYRAYDLVHRRDVAVKVIAGGPGMDPAFGARFRQEAALISRLRHPHILEILDSVLPEDGAADRKDPGSRLGGDTAYLVTEFLPGGNLADRLARPLSMVARCQLAVEVARQIGAALDWAHAGGVLHRDVKPSNILVAGDGRFVLADFGLARALEAGMTHNLTMSGLVAGTPAYMAPEQARGEPADSRTDIYSLGVVLYEIIAGRVPFQAETPMAVMLAHVHQPAPDARSVEPQVPREVAAILGHALAKAREDRYQTGTELARALRAAVASVYGEAAIDTGALPVVEARRERQPHSRTAARASKRRKPRHPGPRRWPAAARRAVAVLAGTAFVALGTGGGAALALGPGRPVIGPIIAGYVARFFADPGVPHVMEILPSEKARLPLRGSITVRFSHPMDLQSVQDALAVEPPVPLELEWDGQLLHITPQVELLYGTTYTFTIDTRARDLEGRPLEKPLVRRYTTVPLLEAPRPQGNVIAAPLATSAPPAQPTPVPPAPTSARPAPARPPVTVATATPARAIPTMPAGLATVYTPPTVAPLGPDQSLVAGLLETAPAGAETPEAGAAPPIPTSLATSIAPANSPVEQPAPTPVPAGSAATAVTATTASSTALAQQTAGGGTTTPAAAAATATAATPGSGTPPAASATASVIRRSPTAGATMTSGGATATASVASASPAGTPGAGTAGSGQPSATAGAFSVPGSGSSTPAATNSPSPPSGSATPTPVPSGV